MSDPQFTAALDPAAGVAPQPGTPPAGDAAPVEPQIDWNSDANPLRGQLAEIQARVDAAEARAAQIEQQRNQEVARLAQAAEQFERQQWKQQFTNGQIDAEEYQRRTDAAIEAAERRAKEIVYNETLPLRVQEWAGQVSQHYGLTTEEHAQLAQVPGEAMEYVAQQLVNQRNLAPRSEIDALKTQLDQLQRSMAAQSISGSGLPATLQGNPQGQGGAPANETSLSKLHRILGALPQ